MNSRIPYLLLALSIGINIGLAYRSLPGADETSMDPPRPKGPREEFRAVMDNHLDRMADGLDLSDEQVASIRQVLDRESPGIIAQRDLVDGERRTLRDIYVAPVFDRAAYRAQLERLHSAQAVLDERIGNAMVGEAVVLDEEQRRRYVRGMPWGQTGRPPPPKGPPRRRPPRPKR